jgi:PKD repeat protein
LDDYVFDVDNEDSEITWTVENQLNLTISINSNREAVIEVKDVNWNGNETIKFIANSPGNLTSFDYVLFTVLPVNDIPIVSDITDQTIDEDTSFTSINLNNFVVDVEDEYSQISWSATGQSDLTVNINNNVASIEAAKNWNGTETITFIAKDSEGLTASDQAIFTVTPVNDAPEFTKGQDISVPENSSLTSIVNWATNIGPGAFNENDSYYFELSNYDVNLFSVMPTLYTNGTLEFTPKADMFGVANIDVLLKDNGGTANGGNDTSASQSFKITIVEINDPPILTIDQNQRITVNTSLAIPFTVSDAQGGDITVSVVSNTDNLTIANINGLITSAYTFYATSGIEHSLSMLVKAGNRVENISITITAGDSSGCSTTKTVFVTILPESNEPPVISGIPDQSRPEGQPFTMIHLDDFVVDPNNNDDEMIWTAEGGQQHFTITIDSNRIAAVTPKDPEWNGSETVIFKATDSGGLTATQATTFTVIAVNDPPVFSEIPDQSQAEGNPFTVIHLDDYVFDIDSNDDSITWIAENQNHLTITINSNREAIIKTKDPEWNGSETIKFIATAPDNVTSVDYVVFTVTAVNDAPVISDIGDQTIDEDFSFTPISLDLFIFDIEDSDSQITWSVIANSELAVTITDRIATIKAVANWNGTETITFIAEDTGGLTASDSAIFTVNSVNDAPVISGVLDQTVNEDTSFTAITLDEFVADIEDADSQISWAVSGNSDLTITITNRVILIESPANWHGSETIIFKATDSGGLTATQTATFTVIAVNDPPVFSEIPDQSQAEGNPFSAIHLDDYVFDIDSNDDSITWIAENQNHLTITINSNREAIIKTKDPEWNGSETIKFIATAPDNVTSVDYVVFTVTAVNDTPLILYFSDNTIMEGDSFPAINLDDYVVDVDNTDDEISWSATGQSDLKVSITDRIATIEAPENWNGTETITFTVQDPGGLTSCKAVKFMIVGPPNISDIPDQTILEDTSFTSINLDDFVDDSNFSDSEISWSITGQSELSISLTNRVVSIKAPENWNGTENLIFIAEVENMQVGGDLNELLSWTEASFTMTAINDPPSFTIGQNISVPEDSSTIILSYWTTNISPGAANENDSLHFELTIDHKDLFSVIPTLYSNGTLKFTPKPNVSGVATVDVILKDNGGTENGGNDTSTAQSFKITINEINDPPTFTMGPNQRINSNTGIAQHVENWATYISAGPANEDQTKLRFQTTVENDALLEGGQNGIFISSEGDLTYTPTATANGTITVTVILEDGGTGRYTSGEQTFTITLKTTNQAPSFVKGSNVTIDEDEALTITIQSWATNISPGASNEMHQKLEFHLSPDNSGLFAIPPKIMIDTGNVGHLFFAPAKNAFGSSTVSVYLKDNAGTALGGVDTSATQEFIITINPVNDPPVFTKGPNIIIKQNTSKTIDNWAKGISFGPANETGQILTFHTTAVPASLFINQPQISSTGTLTFRTSSSQTGIATVSVYLDDSATNNNTSTTETFTINVSATSPPQLSDIEDYEILQDCQTDNILIEVTDKDTPINDITVTATSSNTELVNTNNLALSIINEKWLLSITPITGQSGVTTITVSADDGSKATDKTFILTVHAIPSAQISVVSDQYSTTTGTVPLLVHFTPASIQNENEITGWRWDFGDGRTSTDQSPFHTFYLDNDLNDPSVYTVRLTIYGFNGSSRTDTKTNYITINRLKYVNFNAINKVGSENLKVDFFNQSIGFGTNKIYQWDFGDGTKSSLENPSHIYTNAGVYSVTLAASNGSITQTMSKPDFVKVSGRSISGQIIANDTTLGIENCLVEIWSAANNVLLANTYTAPDGSYTIKDFPSLDNLIIGAWPPLALRDQYYKAFYDGADNRSDAKKVSTLTSSLTGQNITLEKIPEMGIRGRIFDMDGITGLANSEVDVFSDHLQTGCSATTDAEGFYTVTGLHNASDYIVSIWSENLNREFFYSDTGTVFTPQNATKIELAGVYVDHITITVLPSGSISGHVSLNGQPLANIWISAWSDILGIGNKALSNESGDYTISGLISQSNAKNITYIVACQSQDYPYQAYNRVSDQSLATPVSTGCKDIDFNIKTGNDIKGIVTDSNYNLLSSIIISAWSESKNIRAEVISQSSGEYTLSNMPIASDYKLVAISLDYLVQYYNQQKSSETATIVDNMDGDVDNIDFIMNRGGIIKGYVKIENDFTSAGEGIWLNIWSKSTNTGGYVVTDVNGMYEISGLEPTVSDYKISIYQENYMPAFFNSSGTVYESKDAESVTPSTTEYRNMVLKSGLTITGKITYAGTPISGIKIEAFSEQNNGWGEATSTATLVNNSNYTIKGLIPGTYNITISPENYISETKIKIVKADISNFDYILIAPDRKISGTITGLDLNKEVSLSAQSEELNDSKVISIRGTGNDIVYEITGLKPASDFRVDLRSSDYPYQVYNGKTEWDKANVLDLTDSDRSGVNFTLESANLVISGTLAFPTVNHEHVWVEAYSKALNFTKGIHVNYIGYNPVSYQIEGLIKGSYIVSIWPDISKSQYYDGSETEKNAQAVDLNTGSKTNINFKLITGSFIEGYVYGTDGKPASSVKVYTHSKNSDSWGVAQTNSFGFYRIEGLNTENDFIVQAQKTGMATLYFNSNGSVTKDDLAEMVNANSSNINMKFFVIESITGIVRGANKERISSSILVTAKSELNQIENSVYASYVGMFKIDGLLPGNDYKITAEPHSSSPYMSQSKTNISTNTTDIFFMLEKGHSIEGYVSSHSTVISNVKIEVLSIDADCYAFAKTDSNGYYEINGLKPATDYAVTATPPEESSYLVSINEHNEITTDITFNILLESAFNMSGHIYEPDGTTPVPALRITVFSSDQNFMSDAITDASGYYRVENIPEASDYIVTAIPSNFAQQKRTDQSAGSTVDFILSSGGAISGSVDTFAGPLKNATVEVFSETLNISKSDITDANGNYLITGLQKYWNGILVSDYVVTVYASGYPNESKGQKSVGDVVNFTLTTGEENEISGIIKDSTGALLPSDAEIVWIKVFLNGVYQTKAKVKQDGTGAFTVKGLQPNTNYTLQVSDSTKSEWIGSDGIGVSDSADAAIFTSSDTVDFSFGVEVTYQLPTVRTGGLFSASENYKILYKAAYLVSSNDDTPVTMRGVCWDIFPEPTLEKSNCSKDGTGTGRYEAKIKNAPFKYIYYRAYATNAAGTAYGNKKSVLIPCKSGYNINTYNPEYGGKIEIFPEDDGCYRDQQHATVKAIPDSCYRFTGWTGDCSGTGLCGLIMTSKKTAIPSFERLTHTVTVSAKYGRVSPQIDQVTYDCGTSISLAVTPNAGYRFDHWEGGLENEGATATIIVDQPLNLSAICVPIIQNRSISGYVRNIYGRAVANVSMLFSETGDIVHTNAAGFYEYTLAQDNSVTVIPELSGCTFSPPERSYVNFSSSINAQNYTVTTVSTLQPGLRVWIDKNANAVYDTGEEVSGAEIYLNGSVELLGTTDEEGVIGFLNFSDTDRIHAEKTYYSYVSPKADDSYYDNDRMQNPYYASTDDWSMDGKTYIFSMTSDIRMADGSYQEFPGDNNALTTAPKDFQGNILVQLIHPLLRWNLVVWLEDAHRMDLFLKDVHAGLQGGIRLFYNVTDGYFIVKNIVLVIGRDITSSQAKMANVQYGAAMTCVAKAYVMGVRSSKENIVISIANVFGLAYSTDIIWWGVLAHELSHYLLGVYDEYKNANGSSNWEYRYSHEGEEFPTDYGIMDDHVYAGELSDVTDYYPHDYNQREMVSSHYNMTKGQSCWDTFKENYTEEIKNQMQANGYTDFSDDFYNGLIVPPHTTGSYPDSDNTKRPGPIMIHERDVLNFVEW